MSTPITVNQEALLDAYLRAYDLTLESDNPDYDLIEKLQEAIMNTRYSISHPNE